MEGRCNGGNSTRCCRTFFNVTSRNSLKESARHCSSSLESVSVCHALSNSWKRDNYSSSSKRMQPRREDLNLKKTMKGLWVARRLPGCRHPSDQRLLQLRHVTLDGVLMKNRQRRLWQFPREIFLNGRDKKRIKYAK